MEPSQANHTDDGVASRNGIAITGISGRFPESSNIEEFKNNLFNGVDMVNDDPRRWKNDLYGLPTRIGKIKNEDLENFDREFFNVHQKQADCLDSQMRMLLECTYEALVDAGVSPSAMRGSRTGVYIGVSTSESEEYWTSEYDRVNGYGLIGCSRFMLANRISFTFDFRGPSYPVDTACSSSLYALEHAFNDMRSGRCDSAIVAGSSVLLKPTMSMHYNYLNMLSPDGKCKTFDESVNGYVRSDACVALFLQKTDQAKRLYATILNIRTSSDGYKENGITYPNGTGQYALLRQTYDEINLNPNDVAYVEAHGTGTKLGDPEEGNCITDFFCQNRKEPLLIGSVKSNMGHAEAASGLCSIAKVLIAMEDGNIPANLHYNTPNPDLYGLTDGRLKVVDKHISWEGGIVGINSLGFGGTNAHVILKSNPKTKSFTPTEALPKIVLCSGRTFEAVRDLLDDAISHQHDDEYLALINGVYSKNIPLHYYRGYCIMDPKGSCQREVLEIFYNKRPIWYIYSGMGSQWASMAKDMMQFEVFANSINRLAEVLRPMGVDVLHAVAQSTDRGIESMLHATVSIVAMQVALTDLLTSMGITPNGIIGHSLGEFVCAYADGCLTAEQVVLSAYWRAISLEDANLPKGKMAAVGLSWEDVQQRIPADCYRVCHNSADNCTIAGPENSIEAVVAELSAQGVFCRAVNSSGYAFHTKYLAEAGPTIQRNLEKIIPNPKNRTQRWISTSVPEADWNTSLAKQCSAAYYVNNILSPVHFYESLQHVPKHAIVIEVAPTGLLQAILKRALDPHTMNISLVHRGHEDNAKFFLTSMGKLYAAGAQPQIMTLFKNISYPVGRGTPMLSHKVGWNHSQKYFVPRYDHETVCSEATMAIDLSKEEDAFLAGNNIDGRTMFPAAGFISMAWKTFAKMRGMEYEKCPIVMENVVFHRTTILNRSGVAKFSFRLLDASGKFEICEGRHLAVSGEISQPEHVGLEELTLEPLPVSTKGKELNVDDVYKELRRKGYNYTGIFQGILQSDSTCATGRLQWTRNWITFMDTMLQFTVLDKDTEELFFPKRIEKIVLNGEKHIGEVSKLSPEQHTKTGIPLFMYKDINVIKCGGIEIRGLKFSHAPSRTDSQNSPTLERYTFIPYINMDDLDENTEISREHALTVALHIILENSECASKIKGVEFINDSDPHVITAPRLLEMLESEPLISADIAVVTSNNNEHNILSLLGPNSGVRIICRNILEEPVEQNCHFLYALDVLARVDTMVLENALKTIKDNGFLLFEEYLTSYRKSGLNLLKKFGLIVISEQIVGKDRVLVMVRKPIDVKKAGAEIIEVTGNNFDWVDPLRQALAKSSILQHHVYIVCQGQELFGAVGLMNCIKYELGGNFARLIFIKDKEAEKFSLSSAFYGQQLSKDLTINVLKGRAWGSFRHLKLESNVVTLPVERAFIKPLMNDGLASIKWIKAPQLNSSSPHDNLELCHVYYAPINFRHPMLARAEPASDDLEGNCVFGLEFAGRDSNGRRIMAMVRTKYIVTTCLASKDWMWAIPENWSMEEASTVPCAYATAYYALVVRGQIRKGDTILIHTGSGSVGQAAICIALHHGLTVFTTVANTEHRDFLKQRFPQLKDSHIGNSRDCSFEEMIKRQTRGQGVDLVLNSLSEEKLQASLRCLGVNGRFMDIGNCNVNISFSLQVKNVAFHNISLDSVTEKEQKQITDLVAEGITSGAVRPLPATVFNDDRIEEAFRCMASGKYIGKTVIKVRDEEEGRAKCRPTPRILNAIGRTYMCPDKCYIMVGGLGDFGLELSNWLVSRGAKFLVLTSSSGVKTGYQVLMIKRWQRKGVTVLVDTNDVTTSKGCQQVLENANRLASVGGIFNLAGVLRDGLLENQSSNDFKLVCDPKVKGTELLDQYSRIMCSELDYFVCFSSTICGRGSIGQSNYGLANSAMERICEMRQVSGFPGLAIQWGVVGNTGMASENLDDNNTVTGGILPQRMTSCLETMDYFLQLPHPVLASMVLADKGMVAFVDEISPTSCVANILGLRDIKSIQESSLLTDMGMDSLMVAEIKETLERNFDIVLPASEIWKLTFDQLKQLRSVVKGVEDDSLKSAIDNDIFDYGTKTALSRELMPKMPIVRLVSAARQDCKKNPLFLISPIEGFADNLKQLALRIERPVYGLQCTADANVESVEALAEFYLKHIRTTQPKGPYCIAGYSFGALVAFAIVLLLEKETQVASLVMLDGAPEYLNWHIEALKQRLSMKGDQLESSVLAYFATLVANMDYNEALEILLNTPTWEGNKANKCAEMIEHELRLSRDLIKTAAEFFYLKIMAALNFVPVDKVCCQVTLVKPTETNAELEEDYGLNELCHKSVKILRVEGNHRTILLEEESLKKIEGIFNSINY